jgi:hypothetical protein
VLTAEHFLDLAGLHFLIERVEGLLELVFDRFPCIDPLREHLQILPFDAERHHQVTILLHAPAALEDLLRFGLVLPEIGRCGPGFDAGEFFFGSGGFKDSYADPQRVG